MDLDGAAVTTERAVKSVEVLSYSLTGSNASCSVYCFCFCFSAVSAATPFRFLFFIFFIFFSIVRIMTALMLAVRIRSVSSVWLGRRGTAPFLWELKECVGGEWKGDGSFF